MARFLNVLMAVCLMAASAGLQADALHDPMRPPPAFMPGSLPAVTASAPLEKPLVLQSVLLSPQRKLAIISGQGVKLGQSVRGYQLVGLSSKEARLLGENGLVVLKLMPTQAADPALSSGAVGPHTRGEPK
ncbi:MAG: hypothetical protein IPO35_11770 [Uliginosibacterium sp.]|jgi:hypothetical protein|nr:hypothetical protein [Uliginosibacterium sp.]MBK9392806.1 hypothetical protein [Uliginosibacterium sp.]MBK9616141.1 hypothetical protein [Uliginosibacterium sp.]